MFSACYEAPKKGQTEITPLYAGQGAPLRKHKAVIDLMKSLIQEGVAIALFLLKKHKCNLLPEAAKPKSKAIQWMMFANASVHRAYSKLFFAAKNISNSEAKAEVIDFAFKIVNELWSIVNDQLGHTKYLTGDSLSVADIMLSVYANWNGNFP